MNAKTLLQIRGDEAVERTFFVSSIYGATVATVRRVLRARATDAECDEVDDEMPDERRALVVAFASDEICGGRRMAVFEDDELTACSRVKPGFRFDAWVADSGDELLNWVPGWRPWSSAPKNATWVEVLLRDRTVKVAHWAEDLSGEEQPPFSGWFVGKGEQSFSALIGEPIGWRPL